MEKRNVGEIVSGIYGFFTISPFAIYKYSDIANTKYKKIPPIINNHTHMYVCMYVYECVCVIHRVGQK